MYRNRKIKWSGRGYYELANGSWAKVGVPSSPIAWLKPYIREHITFAKFKRLACIAPRDSIRRTREYQRFVTVPKPPNNRLATVYIPDGA